MGRIITIVVVVLLVVAGIWWWRTYHSGTIYDGTVTRRDAAMENGTTTLENGQNLGEAHPTPSRSDAPGTINGDPIRPAPSEVGTQTTPVTQDPYGKPGPYAASGPYAQTGPNTPAPPVGTYTQPQPQTNPANPYQPNRPQVSYSPTTPVYPAPQTDSQSPNSPNGLRFGGSGSFQWYRQGNLTFRVDTQNGASCIVYATMEEWRKPWVYRNGCHAS